MKVPIEGALRCYANSNIEEDPGKIRLLFEIAQQFLSIDPKFFNLSEKIIDCLSEMSRRADWENIEIARSWNRKYCGYDIVDGNVIKLKQYSPNNLSRREFDHFRIFSFAYESTYSRDTLDLVRFENKDKMRIQPKKYLTYQEAFRKLLWDIIEGKEYSAISLHVPNESINRFPETCYDLVQTRASIVLSDNDLKEEISQEVTWGFRADYLLSNDEWKFNDLVVNLANYCLCEFLINNDRRKLKYCRECSDFYISKTVRPSKFCSDKCRMAYNNRKRVKSGEAREYKRRKRREGAKESYYG